MPIHLIIQYCNDPRPARQAEYDECLRRNLANPHIAAVHDLLETQTNLPEEFRDHPKHRLTVIGRWMTYRDAFEYANTRLPGETVAIANADIFLDPNSPWDQASAALESGIVLCQSRTEFAPGRPPFKDPEFDQMFYANSQDAWIFRAPLEVPECDFEIGELGCDNAIADRIRRTGKIPVNLADRFVIFHYDQARGKTFANQKQVHQGERADRPQRHPEQHGQYLVPNMDQAKSIDQMLTALGVSDLNRYQVYCDVLSHFLKIGNK